MGIDRAKEGDVPERGPERSANADAIPPPDPRELVAENARYRTIVKETYAAAAARDAWSLALPGLCSAWERHEERYPERTQPTPRTQPDGSWVADRNRELDPKQNADATMACAEIREEGERVILPAMRRVESAD